MLCVLRDRENNAGFFLTEPSRGILVLPKAKGESTNVVFRKFLFEVLLHLQGRARLALQPDLSAYLSVFGLDKVTRLQFLMTRFFGENNVDPTVVIELVYLMGEVPGIPRDLIQKVDSVFTFEHEVHVDNTLSAEVWLYRTADGTTKPIRARDAWQAAKRTLVGESVEGDQLMIQAMIQWFRRMKERHAKLIIKPEADISWGPKG